MFYRCKLRMLYSGTDSGSGSYSTWNQSDPPWLYHDRKHGNRNGYTACRCKPVCWMWYCKDLTERDIHSSSPIHCSINRGTVTYNLCTYNLNVPAESAWVGT